VRVRAALGHISAADPTAAAVVVVVVVRSPRLPLRLCGCCASGGWLLLLTARSMVVHCVHVRGAVNNVDRTVGGSLILASRASTTVHTTFDRAVRGCT